jgi:photosystem II stability/assembly factor-like uncharacterized protein
MRSLALILSLALFALLAPSAAASVNVAQSGWSWGTPAPQGNTLVNIDFTGARGFAAGAAGTVLRTDDGGATWTGLATGTSADIDRLQVVDPDTVLFLGGKGCVLRRSDDGGATFHKIFIVAEQNCPAPVKAFTFVGKQVGYLLLTDGSVMRTADAGATFARQTAVPGTAASTGGGNAQPVDIAFTDEHTGFAFVAPGLVFATTDDGISWKPVTAVDQGTIKRVWFLDSKTGFAVGPDTLLQTLDGGTTWKALEGGPGHNLTSIRCTDVKTCLLTVDGGAVLLRTADGGKTMTEITASSQPLYGVAFASPTRVVSIGAGGTTVVSNDAGVNYTPISSDIGGTYFALRAGPGQSAFAIGAKGGLAMTLDAGVTWKTLAVPTSADVMDVAFATADVGYALDVRGALFKTANGGISWQTLDTGMTSTPRAVAAPAANVAILVGPKGVRRTDATGKFVVVGGKPLRSATLSGIDAHGQLLVAYGSGTKNLWVSANGGSTWKAVKLPSKKSRILNSSGAGVAVGTSPVSFLTARAGYLLDTDGRLWFTTTGGKKWKELPATGTDSATHVTFSTPTEGFMVPDLPLASQALVLRTSDGARSWRPELIAKGSVRDMVAGSGKLGFALLGDGQNARSLFFTSTAGEAGSPVTLSLKTPKKVFTKKALKKAKGTVTITGTLSGAVGGEQITVAQRGLTGTSWNTKTATAGANGGSFTTSWKISRSAVFVAQWPGDSGRSSAGSTVLTITVKK